VSISGHEPLPHVQQNQRMGYSFVSILGHRNAALMLMMSVHVAHDGHQADQP
jgi:hypothetical protein